MLHCNFLEANDASSYYNKSRDCRRWNRTTRCVTANVPQTKVDAQRGKLKTTKVIIVEQ